MLMAAGVLAGSMAGFAPRAAATDDDPRAAAMPPEYVDVAVDGREYRVSVGLWRDLTPPSNGVMRISVTVMSLDGEALNLTRFGGTVTQGRVTWKPRLQGSPTALLAPPNTAVFGASGGPRWRPGSTARVTVELTSGRRLVRVPMTVVVGAAR
jgi:hypothetical protein